MTCTRTPTPTPNEQHPRVLATGRLLELLHRRGPLTRAVVTDELGLARSAVGAALDELTALGLVRVGAGTPAGRGRPSPVIELDPGGPMVASIQLGADRVEAGLVGLGQAIEAVDEQHLAGAEREPEAVVRCVADVIRRTASRTGRTCLGVSVALPGFVREPDGFVPSSLHLGWTDIPFADLLASRMPAGLPLTISRASSVAALAEYRYGAGRGAVSALALNCEHRGVGGGFVTDGALLTGTGFALEAGHTVIEPGGRQCPCGARGCLEMYADGCALLRCTGLSESQARSASDQVPGLLRRAAGGDPAAMRAVRTTATYLAAGMTSLVNTLSPERVLLLGFLADLHRAAGDVVREELMKSSIVARAGQVTITTGSLRYPVLLGGAERAFACVLTDPRTAMRGGTR